MPRNVTRPILVLILAGLLVSCTGKEEHIRIVVSTDVHGTIFPYDFSTRRDLDHSLAHLASYLEEKRQDPDTALVLLDNGDFLQGQPTVYFYNYIADGEPHLTAEAMNFLEYDAASVGNHDIETGPELYRRLEQDFNFPWLAANAVDPVSGKPVFTPYSIVKRGDTRIAILGMITPGVPKWLPESLWPGIEFRDMVETAQEWVPRILEREKPDLLIGLFHSGIDHQYGGVAEEYMNENATVLVAEQVPGFDIVIAGHDHRNTIQRVQNTAGDEVLVLDPGSHARYAGEILVSIRGSEIELRAQNVELSSYEASPGFTERFAKQRAATEAYLNDTVCILQEQLRGREALFGPSAFTSLIHRLQLGISQADISFTAPLSISATLDEGPLLVSDLFRLYRYENMLYVLELSGSEIDAFLEHAAAQWFDHPESGHLLKFSDPEKGRLANPYFNFSSAAGIDYTVDVRKPEGERVDIQQMSDGGAFLSEGSYRVAINSYRASGGGGHLTEGAGIPRPELISRRLWFSERDLRFHLGELLSAQGNVQVKRLENWQILPLKTTIELSLSDAYIFE